MDSLLIDTGVLYGMFDAKDKAVSQATIDTVLNAMRHRSVIIPWPVAYETLKTKFVKNHTALTAFKNQISSPRVTLLEDGPYRLQAYDLVFKYSLDAKKPRSISMVDSLLRLVMEDDSLQIRWLATTNKQDFYDVCKNRRIIMV